MTRRINRELLKKKVREMGLEFIAVKAGCSASLLQKLTSEGYKSFPSLRTVDGLCEATGLKLEDLFPSDQEQEKAS